MWVTSRNVGIDVSGSKTCRVVDSVMARMWPPHHDCESPSARLRVAADVRSCPRGEGSKEVFP